MIEPEAFFENADDIFPPDCACLSLLSPQAAELKVIFKNLCMSLLTINNFRLAGFRFFPWRLIPED